MLYTDRYATGWCVAAGNQLAELQSATMLSKGHASAISVRLVPDIFLSIKYVL